MCAETARERYDGYWANPTAPPLTDPLTPVRHSLLWQLAAEAGFQMPSLLDVGCGPGFLLADAEARGWSVAGVDIAAGAIEMARARCARCQLVVHPVEDVPWPIPAQSVDIVASFEVIEHLLQPERLLDGARQVLKSGGYVAISTPYHGTLKNLAIAATAYDKHHDVTGDHVRFFSDAALRDLLQSRGFVVERFDHYGRFWPLWAGTLVWAKRTP